MTDYAGLAAEDFSDIHVAVAEAMAFVTIPVSFYTASPTSADVDPLYGEATDGNPNWLVYGEPIRASIRLNPTDEQLTRFGLLGGAALLGFIPQQAVLDWEADTGLTWAPTGAMEVDYVGTRYNVTELRTDWLPVGDGSTVDTLGHVFTARTKPAKLAS